MGHTKHPEVSSKILSLLRKIDKLDTPLCLKDSKNAEIYIGLINAQVAVLNYYDKEAFLEELGNPKYRIGLTNDRFTGDDVVDFAMRQLNRDRIQSARIVGERLGIKPENCFDAFPPSASNEIQRGARPDAHDLLPPTIYVGNSKFHLSGVDEQKNFGEKVVQAICRYSNENDRFFIIASSIPVSNTLEKLTIGEIPATAWPFSRAEINKNSAAPIVFPMSLHVAFHLREIHHKAKHKEQNVIISGHFGNITALDLHCFCGRTVILLPEFSREGYLNAKEFASKIQSSANDVKIYPWPIVADGMSADAMTAGPGSCWKQAFLEQIVDLRKELAPSSLLNIIFTNALSISKFNKRLSEVGLIDPEKETSQENYETLSPADPALTPAKAFNLSDVTLFHTIRPGSIVMILGAKSAGKTQLALSACRSIIKGDVIWPFFKGLSIDAGNVAYIDAETPHDEYLENLEQHDLARETGRRFWGLSKFAPDLPEFCNTFSLMDKAFRDGLYNFLLRHQCRYIFLDNLTALMGDYVNHGKPADDVLAWVEDLQKRGLCVVFVHHKDASAQGFTQDDKARGCQQFYIRSRTVIVLVSKDEIRTGNFGIESVTKTALQDGLTVGLRFKDCKPAPVLKDKTFWQYLPLGASQWQFLAATGPDGKEIEFAINGTDAITALSEECPSPTPGTALTAFAEHDLSPDQRTVLEILKSGSAKRKDIEKKTDFGEDKVRDLLNSLTEIKMVSKGGQGRATYYALKSTS